MNLNEKKKSMWLDFMDFLIISSIHMCDDALQYDKIFNGYKN